MDNYYAGIGSRETPVKVLWVMYYLARFLADKNWILRSGGASGADTAFERGVLSQEHGDLDIFLPWDGFNGRKVNTYVKESDVPVVRTYLVPEYNEMMARQYHPSFRSLSSSARKLMSRNSYQILGSELKLPSKVVFCYTGDGKASGGTGQAIRIARDYNIPVINLHNMSALQRYFEEQERNGTFLTGSYSNILQQVNNAK